ncbi:MAG: uroporphyrinogen decarboxylase [Opitutales bacterium]|nr:uroporphyrinogen decarboxylase [Opitutales bacterium]
MNSRERFLSALHCKPVDRPPVWMMRQAGRYLPEYRALKQKSDFRTMVQTPELAVEVTLQPLRRYPMDAAILFSDILIIPEALGQPYHFREKGGIEMEFALDSIEQLNELSASDLQSSLSYVDTTLRSLRSQLGNEKTLLGFGGSPWTLATYMVEGGSSTSYRRLMEWYYTRPADFEALMEKLCDALIALFRMMIDAGVDAIQVFDSWGAACAGHLYRDQSLRWIERIIQALPADFPVILFAKGMAHHAESLHATGARGLSLDASTDLRAIRDRMPLTCALQGNLDSQVLTMDPAVARAATESLLKRMQGSQGHIFNLGHGITPDARLESVAAMLECVTGESL